MKKLEKIAAFNANAWTRILVFITRGVYGADWTDWKKMTVRLLAYGGILVWAFFGCLLDSDGVIWKVSLGMAGVGVAMIGIASHLNDKMFGEGTWLGDPYETASEDDEDEVSESEADEIEEDVPEFSITWPWKKAQVEETKDVVS